MSITRNKLFATLSSIQIQSKYFRPPLKLGQSRLLSCSVAHQSHQGHYDIAIVGGGLVGKSLAAGIARNQGCSRYRVALLDAAPLPSHRTGEPPPLAPEYSNRVTALSPASQKFLSEVGAWEAIESSRVCPVQSMQVWESCSDAAISFSPSSQEWNSDAALAYIVENDVILSALDKSLAEVPGPIDYMYDSPVTECKRTSADECGRVSTTINGTVAANLVIGTDGYNSIVRRTFALPEMSWSYKQHAIVATLETSLSQENTTAWQRFLPTGPIAVLPLSPTLSSLVWTLPSERAAALVKVSEEEFVDEVNKALWKESHTDPVTSKAMKYASLGLELAGFEGNMGLYQLPPTFVRACNRAMFPLGFMLATQYACPGAALVGDSAHRIHPLAGQGLNLGLGDVREMCDVLSVCAAEGGCPSDLQYLQLYETARQRQSLPIVFGVDALHRLYSTNFTPVVLARSLGLMTCNSISFVKNMFRKQATS